MSDNGCGGHCGHAGASGGDGYSTTGLGPFHPDPARKLSVNGAPIIEQSHEYVLPEAPKPEAQKLLGISLEGSVG
jgi:hypothetical protein